MRASIVGGHICICVPGRAPELLLSPPIPFCTSPETSARLLSACGWMMVWPAPWCQVGPEHLQHLPLTWNSKLVCSRNFWFMVSANLLIALRKTLEEKTMFLDHPSLLSLSSSQQTIMVSPSPREALVFRWGLV